jgi:hypothetical protein
MIIGIDGNDANVAQMVGVSVYTHNLLSYFQKKATADVQFKVFLRNPPLSSMPAETDFLNIRLFHQNRYGRRYFYLWNFIRNVV